MTMNTKEIIGNLPGEVIFTGDKKVSAVKVHHLTYNGDTIAEIELDTDPLSVSTTAEGMVSWRDVRGMHDIVLIESLGKQYGIHPMMVADIVDTHHHSVFIEDSKGIYILLKSMVYSAADNCIVPEHIALYFTPDLLLSFQEDHTDVFQEVRRRLHTGRGLVRHRKADYLAYTLIDSIVDNYFVVLEQLEERVF